MWLLVAMSAAIVNTTLKSLLSSIGFIEIYPIPYLDDNNAYLIVNSRTKRGVVVDPIHHNILLVSDISLRLLISFIHVLHYRKLWRIMMSH